MPILVSQEKNSNCKNIYNLIIVIPLKIYQVIIPKYIYLSEHHDSWLFILVSKTVNTQLRIYKNEMRFFQF